MERRNTVQKELILDAVQKMRRHVTAEEVFAFIRAAHPSIGKATVYRDLAVLADQERIRKIGIPDGPDRFDYRTEEHYHVRCVRCGQVSDVDMEGLPGLESRIRDAHGTRFLGYDILFRGICPLCQSKEEKQIL